MGNRTLMPLFDQIDQTRDVPRLTDEDLRRHRGRTKKLLTILAEGDWVSTARLADPRVGVGHRFSTNMQSLRDQGFVIEKRPCKGHGGWEYRYAGKGPTRPATRTLQQRYYATPHWKLVRDLRLEFDERKCCRCHAGDDLHVHHWRYDLFQERLEDVMTLCQQCHDAIHAEDKIQIGFPKRITETEYQRIQAEWRTTMHCETLTAR